MSETLDPVAMELDQRQLAEQLLAQAKEQGVELVGPNGLLNQLTKNVLETALDAEMVEHLGYDKHDPPGGAAATPATVVGPRRCSPRSVLSRSRSPATPTAASIHRSSRSGSVA
ncbi:transposase [Mycobacterium sp. MOTT36Y]|nr:transposase [Mycobacterium sp. MOTT36Y]